MRVSRAQTTTPLPTRIAALAEAAELAIGRSDEAVVAEAKRVTSQADRRLAFSGERTVVALAGATGSGKSSLFNAIAGSQLSPTGLRRPTTSEVMAACWEASDRKLSRNNLAGTSALDLLDWLAVPEHHLLTDHDAKLKDLILLDLPDHDSTEESHRTEVDRLVKLVDGLVWVLDPQKYADNALHELYLQPLAEYADVMLIVLNQADLLSPADLKVAQADLKKLLDADGLTGVKVIATSALTGLGIETVRSQLASLVRGKRTAAQRLATDVTKAAQGLVGDISRQRKRVISASTKAKVLTALDEVVCLPQVVKAVEQSTRQKGAAATGWPVLSWINRLRPDPLRRWLGESSDTASSRPKVGGAVSMARLDTALRGLTNDLVADLKPGWAVAVRQATTSNRDDIPVELERVLVSADLGLNRPVAWWRVITFVQWLLIGTVLTGLSWVFLAGWLAISPPEWNGVKIPVYLIVAGLVLGLLVTLICHWAVGLSARHRSTQVAAELQAEVAMVAELTIFEPVTVELERYAAFVAAVARAL